jgi:Cu+-exporting ATPase
METTPAYGVPVNTKPPIATGITPANITHSKIPVAGMTCAHCVRNLEEALHGVAGVTGVAVNYSTGIVVVDHDPQQAPLTKLLETIRSRGYMPAPAKLHLAVKGMHCASCVTAVEQALTHTAGVISASVNPASAQAEVVYQPGQVDFQGLQQAVQQSGYEAEATDPTSEPGLDRQEQEQQQEYRTLLRKFWFAAIVSLPVIGLSYPNLIPELRDWMPMGSPERRIVWGILGLLTLPVMLWSGSQFYSCMWAALKHRSANMHTLIALGISAAFLYSVVAVLFPGWFPEQALAEVFWDVAVVVVAWWHWVWPWKSRPRVRPRKPLKNSSGCRPRPHGCCARIRKWIFRWKRSWLAMWYWCGPVRKSPWMAW